MRISHRLPLTSTPVVATRIAELRQTFYWWDPLKRKFVLKHFGTPIEVEDVPARAIAMLVICNGEVQMPDVKPLVPPKKPYRRAAWDFGFTAGMCKPSVECARREIPAATLRGGGMAPHVVESDEFIFIFAEELRSSNVRVHAPFAWATERGATAVAIREALKGCAR